MHIDLFRHMLDRCCTRYFIKAISTSCWWMLLITTTTTVVVVAISFITHAFILYYIDDYFIMLDQVGNNIIADHYVMCAICFSEWYYHFKDMKENVWVHTRERERCHHIEIFIAVKRFCWWCWPQQHNKHTTKLTLTHSHTNILSFYFILHTLCVWTFPFAFEWLPIGIGP